MPAKASFSLFQDKRNFSHSDAKMDTQDFAELYNEIFYAHFYSWFIMAIMNLNIYFESLETNSATAMPRIII